MQVYNTAIRVACTLLVTGTAAVLSLNPFPKKLYYCCGSVFIVSNNI